MTAHALSHVELYTRDKVSSEYHLRSALGFARVADRVEVDRSSVLLRTPALTVVLTSGWATRRFIARHGEGIAVVAVHCDDVDITADAARRFGATVKQSPDGHQVVTALGAVSVALLPAPGTAASVQGPAWVPDPAVLPDARTVCPGAGPILRLAREHLEVFAGFFVSVLGFTRDGCAGPGAGETVLRAGKGGVGLTLRDDRAPSLARPAGAADDSAAAGAFAPARASTPSDDGAAHRR